MLQKKFNAFIAKFWKKIVVNFQLVNVSYSLFYIILTKFLGSGGEINSKNICNSNHCFYPYLKALVIGFSDVIRNGQVLTLQKILGFFWLCSSGLNNRMTITIICKKEAQVWKITITKKWVVQESTVGKNSLLESAMIFFSADLKNSEKVSDYSDEGYFDLHFLKKCSGIKTLHAKKWTNI